MDHSMRKVEKLVFPGQNEFKIRIVTDGIFHTAFPEDGFLISSDKLKRLAQPGAILHTLQPKDTYSIIYALIETAPTKRVPIYCAKNRQEFYDYSCEPDARLADFKLIQAFSTNLKARIRIAEIIKYLEDARLQYFKLMNAYSKFESVQESNDFEAKKKAFYETNAASLEYHKRFAGMATYFPLPESVLHNR